MMPRNPDAVAGFKEDENMDNRVMIMVKTMLRILYLLPRTGFANTTVRLDGDLLSVIAPTYSVTFWFISKNTIFIYYRFDKVRVNRKSRVSGGYLFNINLMENTVSVFKGKSVQFVFKRKAERMETWVTHIRRLHLAAFAQV